MFSSDNSAVSRHRSSESRLGRTLTALVAVSVCTLSLGVLGVCVHRLRHAFLAGVSIMTHSPTTSPETAVVDIRMRILATPYDSITLNEPENAPNQPPNIIRLQLPKEIVSRLLTAHDASVFDHISIDLMASDEKMVLIPQGPFGMAVTIAGPVAPNVTRGFRITYDTTTNDAPDTNTRRCCGFFRVSLTPGATYRVQFESLTHVRPVLNAGTRIDAIDADVRWTGPLPDNGSSK